MFEFIFYSLEDAVNGQWQLVLAQKCSSAILLETSHAQSNELTTFKQQTCWLQCQSNVINSLILSNFGFDDIFFFFFVSFSGFISTQVSQVRLTRHFSIIYWIVFVFDDRQLKLKFHSFFFCSVVKKRNKETFRHEIEVEELIFHFRLIEMCAIIKAVRNGKRNASSCAFLDHIYAI